MENETEPLEKPPSPNGGKIIFLLLALVPIPIGLLLDPVHIFDAVQGSKSNGSFIAFNIVTLICCGIGGIGMCGGFKKGGWKGRLGGVVIGLILWAVEGYCIAFIGCCKGLVQMH